MSWIIRTRNGDTGSSLCLTVALATSAEAQREIPHLFTPREPQAPPRRSRQSNPSTDRRHQLRNPAAPPSHEKTRGRRPSGVFLGARALGAVRVTVPNKRSPF